MKKLIVMFGVILVLAMGVAAQEQTESTVGVTGYGLKAGIDLADFTGSDVSGTTTKVGFIGGGFVEFTVAPQIGIQAEVLYAMKGAKEEGGDNKLKLDYIEIPVLFKYMIPTQSTITPVIFAGPQIGFLVTATEEPSGDDVKDEFKSTDFGLAFGAGVGVQMEAFTLTFDGRYELGLTKIVDFDPAPNVKTSNISFMVGVSFK